MKIYTVGYGGRKPQELIDLLSANSIKAVVDVRLRPDKSSIGTYVRTKDNNKGIAGLLANVGIGYHSFVELGNIFRDFDDWQERYRCFMDKAGELLTERLSHVPRPFCLMCAEKQVGDCHRKIIAEYLASTGYDIVHIE